MEGGPSAEQIREAYIIDELKSVPPEQLIEMLQGETDPDNAASPEQIRELLAWVMEEEDRISGFEEFSNERVEQQVNFEIKRADMYHHADLGALERITLEDVLTLAEQYGLGDAVERIQRRLDEIE